MLTGYYDDGDNFQRSNIGSAPLTKGCDISRYFFGKGCDTTKRIVDLFRRGQNSTEIYFVADTDEFPLIDEETHFKLIGEKAEAILQFECVEIIAAGKGYVWKKGWKEFPPIEWEKFLDYIQEKSYEKEPFERW